MDRNRFSKITGHYPQLRIAVLGDFCLDRYLEIDPYLQETSLETGLPVYNVTNIRSQPGGAGTIVNNLSALGVGHIYPISFCGCDGEGYELLQALRRLPGVCLDGFLQTSERKTFTYCKPLVMARDAPPRELNRLDTKNWTVTPPSVDRWLIEQFQTLATTLDAVIVLDQVDHPGTGVVNQSVLESVFRFAQAHPQRLVLADSRSGLGRFPPLSFKMNRMELQRYCGTMQSLSLERMRSEVARIAKQNGRHVFVTLAEEGILGACPDGSVDYVPAFPVTGPIDIVGAGDCVMANLTAALAAGANLGEALLLASAASNIVIHKLGTTGTADVSEIWQRLSIP